MTSAIDARLAAARSRLRRLRPEQALAAQRDGAVLVDIRPEEDRRREGRIPEALVIHRNYLEWRFDPTSEAALDIAAPDLRVVVFCNEGFTSSLAAADLQDLGLPGATDLSGGYRAWKAAGLPTEAG